MSESDGGGDSNTHENKRRPNKEQKEGNSRNTNPRNTNSFMKQTE